MKIDYTLYLVTDRAVLGGRPLLEAVEQAILGGCTLVQLREKELSSRAFYELALAVKRVTDRHGVPLIINDRLDVAMAVHAAGVHLGQSDLPARTARELIGGMVLGVSATTLSEAEQAVRSGADYLGVGAMCPTGTKRDAALVPMEELRRIRKAVGLPIVAIGGIGPEQAAEFREMGIDGLSVVSAILAAPDIKRASERMKNAFCNPLGSCAGSADVVT